MESAQDQLAHLVKSTIEKLDRTLDSGAAEITQLSSRNLAVNRNGYFDSVNFRSDQIFQPSAILTIKKIPLSKAECDTRSVFK